MAELPAVQVPGAYSGPGEVNLPYAEGWAASAGPNPYATGQTQWKLPSLPALPKLPELPPLEKWFDPNYNWYTGKDETIGETVGGALGDAAWWLGGRVVIVFLGLICIVAGLYLFGTSDVASALRETAKRGVA